MSKQTSADPLSVTPDRASATLPPTSPAPAEGLEQTLADITRQFVAGQVDEALQRMAQLEASCTSDKARSAVLARYATFFHLLEMPEEELSSLAHALALDPTNPRAHYLSALHLMADERWDNAVEALNRAARFYPQDDKEHLAEVYGNLSYCWDQLGDPARAAMYEEIAADYDPEGATIVQSTPWQDLPDDEDVIFLDPITGLPEGTRGCGAADDPADQDEDFGSVHDEDARLSERLDDMLAELGIQPGETLHRGQLRKLKRKLEKEQEKQGRNQSSSPTRAQGAPAGGKPEGGQARGPQKKGEHKHGPNNQKHGQHKQGQTKPGPHKAGPPPGGKK